MTRGTGLFEKILEKERIRIAKKLIPRSLERDNILDIGCGTYPKFLMNVNFKRKYGLDKILKEDKTHNGSIKLLKWDAESDTKLPFKDNYFSVVTILAVIEHIDPKKIYNLISECRRVLRKGGKLIITTPSSIIKTLLDSMALLYLVSKEELREHKVYFTKKELSNLLLKIFGNSEVRIGNFEFFLNIWAYAVK